MGANILHHEEQTRWQQLSQIRVAESILGNDEWMRSMKVLVIELDHGV